MFDFRGCIRFLPRSILNHQSHQQNGSLRTDPIDIAKPCYPHVGFNKKIVFRLALLFNATSPPVLLESGFARHCSWHQNFQLSTRILHDTFEFSIIRINEVDTTQFSSIVKRPLCFSLRSDASDTPFQISGHKVSGLILGRT